MRAFGIRRRAWPITSGPGSFVIRVWLLPDIPDCWRRNISTSGVEFPGKHPGLWGGVARSVHPLIRGPRVAYFSEAARVGAVSQVYT
jgi:hypothetical protein